MKRLTLVIAAVIFSLSGISSTALAQSSFTVGPRLGIDVGDIEEVFIGADVRITSPNLPVIINPTFDFYFTSDPLTFWSLSANALYPIGTDHEAFIPYAGGGLGIYRFSIDEQTIDNPLGGDITIGGDSTTEIGLNLLFGAEFPLETVTPFAEVQYSPIFTEGSTTNLFTLKGGVLFSF